MRTARTLSRLRGGRKRLPPLLFFTDPKRTPDVAAVAATLPREAAVVLRTFGAADAQAQGAALAAARRRGILLLVGADAGLAARLGADGVHLPERMAGCARALKRRRPLWIVTVAAHSRSAVEKARRSGADAAILSLVFPSSSPSAGRPIGPLRFAAIARRARLPVYALGGVKAGTARLLLRSGAAGLAAIDGLIRT